MTTSRGAEQARFRDEETRRVGRPRLSLVADLRRSIRTHIAPTPMKWPSLRYAADPVGFAENILGVELWSKQREILEGVRDHKRCAVCAGRKIGKDFVCAVCAIWYYACFDKARVIMTAPTAKQVDAILWREVRSILQGHGVCLACKKKFPDWRDKPRPCPHSALIEEEPGFLARTGLKSADFREIIGFTANEAEGLAGISGAHLMFIIDEASAYPDELHETIRGNMASGRGREVMISNPTRLSGKFFDAFHKSADLYWTMQMSSEESPNVVAKREVIPGLASLDWVEEQKRDWGEHSAAYTIHVKGQFPTVEEGKIAQMTTLLAATERWEHVEPDGPLRIGVDPAGDSGVGDESGFAARRGSKVLEVKGLRGLSEEAHIIEILGLIKKHGSGEKADVIVDSDGLIGANVYGTLVAYVHTKPENAQPFRLVRVRGSEKKFLREPHKFATQRDEMWGAFAMWLLEGGVLPNDPQLLRDLNAASWHDALSGRVKATPKKDLRTLLGRSPDRGDAVVLATWNPIDYETRAEAQIRTRADVERERHDAGGYLGDDPWRAAEQIDPWAPMGSRRR